MSIWKDSNELQLYLDNYATIVGKKTLKKYSNKFGRIETNKWASVSQYYNRIFSSNFVTIEEYLKEQKNKKSVKRKKKIERSQKKKGKINKYKAYINSDKWKLRRASFIEKYRNYCQCCKKIQISKNLQLHHHTYARVGKERDSDLVLVCLDCHSNIHFKDGKKVKLNESSLRERFEELRVF